MKKSLSVVLFVSLGALAGTVLGGCDPDPDSLEGMGGPNGGPGSSGGNGMTDPDPTNLECTAEPVGESYVSFDGAKLEEDRTSESMGVNRARVKPFAAMEREFKRVLGVVPASLKGAADSFDVPATRWFGETKYSAVSIHAMSTIAFEGCLAYVKGKPSYAAAPTDATAGEECSKLMRKAWSRSPSPEEIKGCTDLAVTALADEKNNERRWAYACASVLSASQFLTF